MAQSAHRDIIVIGASSGGLETLLAIVPELPLDLAASIFLVLHVSSRGTSKLPDILKRAGSLPAAHARDGDVIQSGHIYVAPPDFHLLLRPGSMRVLPGPKENNHRPAIDPLFRTAARVYGSRVIGVVLSGMLDDGAAGLLAIKKNGGIAVVQDPQDALYPDMPRNALAATPVDYCVVKSEIAQLLNRLTHHTAYKTGDAPMADQEKIAKESAIAAMDNETIEDDDKPGTPSVYGCPECGGTLWELQDDEWLRFRCRVGHAYNAEGLLSSQNETLEAALWSAFRNLHESAALARRLAERARGHKHDLAAEKFEMRSRRAEEQARVIRDLLLSAQNKSGTEAD